MSSTEEKGMQQQQHASVRTAASVHAEIKAERDDESATTATTVQRSSANEEESKVKMMEML